ncbi:hypothetical protein [Nocardioides alkalitolerans]|uniref:hypothetical protein n=1 Tax=Nocardioides alkalitolerans TaxID=281714 RepID=UPI00041EE2C2|nr:hypothetical protein [Nocardioides alkalitolerans]
MSEPAITFRAMWPIRDESCSITDLCREATEELPGLVARANAKLLSPGAFSIKPASKVPGSGNTTRSVLLYEAPAQAAPVARPYHRRLSRAAS